MPSIALAAICPDYSPLPSAVVDLVQGFLLRIFFLSGWAEAIDLEVDYVSAVRTLNLISVNHII